MKNYFKLFIAFVFALSINSAFAQGCKNTVKNNSANNASTHWQTHGSTTIATLVGNIKAFQVLESDAHFHQDIAIPSGSKTVNIGGWTRNSQPKATTGHAYLYGYVMDANDQVLEYVQIGVQNKTMIWQYQSKVTNLTTSAKKVRLYLKRSSIKGQKDSRNMAYFDNLTVSFNCKRQTPNPATKPCKNYVKNNAANADEANWNTHGEVSVATLAGGNKSFKVRKSAAHFHQDITIPRGSKKVYFGGWTRNSQLNAPTGHAYLYAYIIDKNDKVLEYVQFGTPYTGMKWAYQDKTASLPSGAVKIRYFLKKSAKKGVADTANNAHLDNFIVTFDCSRKTKEPKKY